MKFTCMVISVADINAARKLVEALLKDEQGAYIRVGRNPVEDIYAEDDCPFEMNKATVLAEGTDVLLVACGEMVRPAKEAAELLKKGGISTAVLDMYCVKPLDTETLLKYAGKVKSVVTVEEHAPTGGLGSMVAQAVAENCPRTVRCLTLPDAPVITGTSQEVFDHYGLNVDGIAKTAKELLK